MQLSPFFVVPRIRNLKSTWRNRSFVAALSSAPSWTAAPSCSPGWIYCFDHFYYPSITWGLWKTNLKNWINTPPNSKIFLAISIKFPESLQNFWSTCEHFPTISSKYCLLNISKIFRRYSAKLFLKFLTAYKHVWGNGAKQVWTVGTQTEHHRHTKKL